MALTFELEDLWIVVEDKESSGRFSFNEKKRSVLCEVDMVMDEYPTPEIPQSLNVPGEAGEPAVYSVVTVRLTDTDQKEMVVLNLNETQFTTFFAEGDDIINNALEWAAEQEIEYE